MKAIAAIKKFFEGSRLLSLAEFKALTPEEREELGRLACKELGVEFEPNTESK